MVPAGSFIMGSPESEEGRTRFEGPQHRVTFLRPFAVGKFSVTLDEWDACVADGGCDHYKPSDANWGRGKRPVINVSWNDAQAYISWLKRKTGRNYHLLSEAQREYVTRAGTNSPFWWGSTISPSQANYDAGSHHKFNYQTAPVNSFQPNPWGLYQVHGNGWEWTEDCWNESYDGAPTDGSAWTSGDCNSRVVRGGSWEAQPRYLRSALRNIYIYRSQSKPALRLPRRTIAMTEIGCASNRLNAFNLLELNSKDQRAPPVPPENYIHADE